MTLQEQLEAQMEKMRNKKAPEIKPVEKKDSEMSL